MESKKAIFTIKYREKGSLQNFEFDAYIVEYIDNYDVIKYADKVSKTYDLAGYETDIGWSNAEVINLTRRKFVVMGDSDNDSL